MHIKLNNTLDVAFLEGDTCLRFWFGLIFPISDWVAYTSQLDVIINQGSNGAHPIPVTTSVQPSFLMRSRS
jgi:hypothetical protein